MNLFVVVVDDDVSAKAWLESAPASCAVSSEGTKVAVFLGEEEQDEPKGDVADAVLFGLADLRSKVPFCGFGSDARTEDREVFIG